MVFGIMKVGMVIIYILVGLVLFIDIGYSLMILEVVIIVFSFIGIWG